ncbi:MAG: hypothetical protein ACI9PP_002433 [Halobacteriales archaeon]|jgi:hypothetical protein
MEMRGECLALQGGEDLKPGPFYPGKLSVTAGWMPVREKLSS